MARYLMIFLIGLFCIAAAAEADTFHLRSGGSVVGELQNPEQKPRSTYVIRLAAGGDVTLDAIKVHRIVTPSPQQRKYEELLKKMPADTVENQWVMAEWCKRHHMTREHEFHLEHVIRLDPDHELARKALKYKRREDGSWSRNEELWKADGYVAGRGGWKLPQQTRIDAANQAREDLQFKWKRDLKMWRRWLGGRRHREAVENITTINDPLAAGPLAEMFHEERSIEIRQRLAEILGRLESRAATRALIRAAIEEKDFELRLQCTKQLKKEYHRRAATRSLVAELRSKDNSRVNRAGAALGVLGDDAAVLPLIKALKTEHKTIQGGSQNTVGVPRNGGSTLSWGSRTRVIYLPRENKGVRNALIAVTDEDFGFDEPKWLHWYSVRTTPTNLNLRRDP
jgi:hypothetical protein